MKSSIAYVCSYWKNARNGLYQENATWLHVLWFLMASLASKYGEGERTLGSREMPYKPWAWTGALVPGASTKCPTYSLASALASELYHRSNSINAQPRTPSLSHYPTTCKLCDFSRKQFYTVFHPFLHCQFLVCRFKHAVYFTLTMLAPALLNEEPIALNLTYR